MARSRFLVSQHEALGHCIPDRGTAFLREAVVLAQFNRPMRASQIENRFTPVALHMHVGRTVVVGILS